MTHPENMIGEVKPGQQNKIFLYTASVCLGVGYGLLFRAFTSAPQLASFHAEATMTFSFLGLGSLLIGLLAVYPVERAAAQPGWRWVFLPVLPIELACGLSVLFRFEGLICMIFAMPAAILCGVAGGILGGAAARFLRLRRGTVVCLAVLPFILAPLESLMKPPVITREVNTQILISAPASTVWENIERVRPISAQEMRDTWAQRVGFPRPVEATLSYEGVGGVRHASFERGLSFLETVKQWEPEKLLSFNIRAETAGIPRTTLDEHVTIGGRYFDVLDGEYRLERLADGKILLHLSSRQRLSTDFNAYASLWTDAVMRTLQNSILEVIKKRCEGANKVDIMAVQGRVVP